MPEMTENVSHPHKPQRKKNKETHNAVERHRKKKINAGINRIGELLPCSQALKQSKNMILDQAYRYITELKQQNDTLLLNGGDKVQAEEIRRLRHQLDELRKESTHYMELLRANGINFLDDPTVHWKGRLGRTRLAKVTPARLVPEGIIVYSNGNVLCPAGEDTATPNRDAGKRSSDDVPIQPVSSAVPASRPKFCLQDPPASPAAQLLPAPGLVAVERHTSDPHVISNLPSAVSYIAVPAVCPLSAASIATSQPLVSTATPGAAPQVSLPLGSLTVPTLASALGSMPQSQESALRTLALDSSAGIAPESGPRSLGMVTLPQCIGDSHALRIGSTGSTQTTWTTLQLGPSSVQPFGHAMVSTASPTQACSSTAQSLGGALLCPTGSVTSIQPVLAQAQVQTPPPVLGPPQVTVQTSVQIPLPPPVQVPLQSPAQAPLQAAPTVLPLLQTMQVLQMRGSVAPPAPQTSSNTKMVILQPANPPPPQAVVREGLANQSSCQHIVIIQANSQNSLQQNVNVNGTPVAVPLTQQIVTSSCAASTTNVHTVGGKHLVHILPRPLAPPTSSPASPLQAPQTITVNGQVFALQAVKPPAGSSTKTALQIIQPTTSEDPNTNLTLRTLGALANLNQSISHVSSQSLQFNVTPPSYPHAPIPVPVTTAAVTCSPALATSTTSVTSPVGGPVTVLLRKSRPPLAAKPKPRRSATKRGIPTKKMAHRQRDDSLSHPGMGAGQNVPATEKQIQSAEPPTSTVMPERCSSTWSTEPALRQSEELNNAQCVTSTVGETSVSGASSTASRPIISSSGSPECVFAVSRMTLTLSGPTVTNESPTQSKSTISTASSPECSKSVVIFTISGPTVSPVSEPVVSSAALTEFPPAVSCVSSSVGRPVDSPMNSTVSKLLVTGDASTDGNNKVPCSSFTVTGVSSVPQLSLLTGTLVSHPVDLQDSLPNRPSSLTATSLAILPTPCSVFTSPPAVNVLSPLTQCAKSTPSSQTVISPLEPTILSLASPQGNTVPTEPSLKTLERDCDPSGHRVSDERTDKGVSGGGELSSKASAPPQHVCEMEQDTLGQPLLSNQQTESPVLAGPGGARGFSVASMLPPCHGVSAPGVSYATFTFTSEQAEILAMAARAIFEQDSPGRRSGSCGMESPTPGLASGLTSGPTSDWDLAKTQQISHSKERSTGSQLKLPKPSEMMAAKSLSQVTVESLEAPARELLAASYPQSSQAHSQSSQSPSVASLSVNNLIRPTSSCQPYPCSPSLPQQVSAPSPVVPSMTQPPVLLPPCSASGQLSELTPSKTALMRAAGAERRMKDLPKRTAQDDMMASGSKRPKPCSANAVTRVDMKAVSSDHVQMMPGHLPASLGSSSAPGNRAHPTDGLNPLFPGNSFMNTVLSHCSSQVLPQEHLQPSRSQHGNAQPGHHQSGNPYLKQQEQQQLQGQRQHLYQLQHHLIQPDPAQLHSLHQRVLQQDQHIQKKQGMVRGGQQAPICLTQKQHHVEKNGVHQQPQQQHHQQQQQQQPQQQHHQQQQQQQPQQQHHQQQQQQQQSQQQHHQQQQPQQQHHQQQQQQSQQQHHQQQQPQQQHHQQQQQPQQQHHQQQQQPQQQHHQQQQQQPQQHHQQQPQQQHHQQQQQQTQQHHQQQQSQQPHHQQQQTQQQHHQQQQQQPQQQHHQQQQQLPQQQPHHQQQQPQQPQQQASHSMHQHIQQQLHQQQHFSSRHQEKSLLHPQQQPRQDQQVTQSHNVMQRLISSRSLEQQLTPQAGSTVSRSSDMTCAPSRQERHRISSYSAEALIGKSSSSGAQRLGLPLQAARSAQDQPDMRPYLDVSRGKGTHNPQGRLPPEHPGSGDLQRISECAPFKALSGGQHTLAGFEAQASKPGPTAHRAVQTQGFRMGSGVAGDRQPRGPYPGQQGVSVGTGVQQDHDSCQQSFMQSLLVPQVEQVGHQRAPQCCPPVSMEYGCVSGTSGGDLQAKAGSPSVPPIQKPPAMRLSDTSKGHINVQIGGNMHSAGVRAGLHPPTSHSSAESTLPAVPPTVARSLNVVSQRSRHLGPDAQSGKLRSTERSRPSTLRPGNPFESEGHLALPTGGGVLLGRQQPGSEARRGSIVRFMADSVQVGGDGLVSDQHLAQNFGFSFIPDNAPTINTNPTFMPPVSQPSTARTPAILPVEPQAPLSSFYPSYSPAAHPSLPSDIQLQYFPNQMFSSPNTEKASGPPLNNRFGSILSPPRPVGFAQASFPLLTDMPPMPITNSSAITPHLSNFNLTSLFPEIATAMPADGSTMPMSPLLSLTNTSSSDSGKQPNRPAHNISHILGHDGSSAI